MILGPQIGEHRVIRGVTRSSAPYGEPCICENMDKNKCKIAWEKIGNFYPDENSMMYMCPVCFKKEYVHTIVAERDYYKRLCRGLEKMINVNIKLTKKIFKGDNKERGYKYPFIFHMYDKYLRRIDKEGIKDD